MHYKKYVYTIVQCRISSEFNECRYTYMRAYTPIYGVTEKIEMTKKKVAVVTGSSSGDRLRNSVAACKKWI